MKPRVPELAKTFIDQQEESGSQSPTCKAYWDSGGIGGWAIGPGIHAEDVNQFTVWTREQVIERFGKILDGISEGICPNIVPELSDSQLAACMSLAYNLVNGVEQFNGSTLLKLINKGDMSGAANEFPKWCHETKPDGSKPINDKLLARRNRERDLFLQGTAGPEPPATPPQESPSVPVPALQGGTKLNPIKSIQTARPLTKVLLGLLAILGSALQDPTVQATIAGFASHHKGLASALLAIGGIAALIHEPQAKQ